MDLGIQNKLFVVATDLNTGRSVKFGAERHDHVPISRAVQASSALPGVFPPVQLQARNVDGDVKPYLPSRRWIDG